MFVALWLAQLQFHFKNNHLITSSQKKQFIQTLDQTLKTIKHAQFPLILEDLASFYHSQDLTQ